MKRLLAVLALMASSTFAGTISVVGNLNPDDPNDVALITFALASAGPVNMQSYGYGGSANAPGGTNAAGAPISPGGFDTYFSLFLGSGPAATFLLSNDDGLCPPGTAAPGCADATIVTSLAAGVYTLAVTVFDNFSFAENLGSGTLGDGFIGLGDYYDAASGTTRTPAYAVDITTNDTNPPPRPEVPEPGSLVLFGSAAIVLVLSRLRRSGSTD